MKFENFARKRLYNGQMGPNLLLRGTERSLDKVYNTETFEK